MSHTNTTKKQKLIALLHHHVSGQRLVWAVHHTVTGKALDIYSADWQRVLKTHHYITDWGKAGPLIDKHHISVEYDSPKNYCAYTPGKDCVTGGDTFLVAAMRCLVDSHTDGMGIWVPEELPA